MVRTQIQLEEEQAERLRELAARLRVSQAQLIRQALDDLLRRQAAPSDDERVTRALSVVGMCHSGLPDLATRHDHYLEEAFSDDSLPGHLRDSGSA